MTTREESRAERPIRSNKKKPHMWKHNGQWLVSLWNKQTHLKSWSKCYAWLSMMDKAGRLK